MTRPVIIIFGAKIRPDGRPSEAMCRRVEAALATGRQLKAPRFLPTGGQGRHGPPEAEVMAELLRAAGVAATDIILERTARNTLRSAQACARLLGAERPSVYVATSAYHMPRCLLLLRLAGVRAQPGRAVEGAASTRLVRRWYWRLREVPALPIDAAMMVVGRVLGRL